MSGCAVPEALVPRAVRHPGRAEGRRTGSNPLPTREQRNEAEAFFLNGMTQAMRCFAERRTPLSRSPSTTPSSSPRPKGRRRREHWLGDLSRCGDPFRFRDQRHLADAHRAVQPYARHGHQRPRLQHRPRLPAPSGDAPAATRREFLNTLRSELPHGAAPPANRQYRPGRSRPGRHWPRHGGLHPLREGARRGRRAPARARGVGAH